MACGGGRVQVIENKGCSRQVFGFIASSSPSFRFKSDFSINPIYNTTMSPNNSILLQPVDGPFKGLVVCVTGLSKEARKQVMEATESFGGRKLEHALKHGSRNGLFLVTLGWFVDSVRRQVRLSESLYNIKSVGENSFRLDELNRLVGFGSTENSCLPAGIRENPKLNTVPLSRFSAKEPTKTTVSNSVLSDHSMYIDSDISTELYKKICDGATREGASFVDRWFIGCSASHVVCEGNSAYKYLGHSNNIVTALPPLGFETIAYPFGLIQGFLRMAFLEIHIKTPLWVLKTAKEKNVQRVTHISADLARQVGTMLENSHNTSSGEESREENVLQAAQSFTNKGSLEGRQQIVNSAKLGVRNRRGRRMQTCQIPIRPITPSNLLDSICWSISEQTSTASIFSDSISVEDVSGLHDTSVDTKLESEASFANLTRPLTESEKGELVFKTHFLTILFPIDRFSEMGPSSRTFFSNNGFTCLQVLDHIYAFYQENMSDHEIEVAIHSDSRHADRLRSVYCSKETHVTFKRIEFLGSRKSFEMLKRVSGDNSSNVYELLIRA
ncbi:hypothetical protein ACFE04_014119 [Oxalis oulophora]